MSELKYWLVFFEDAEVPDELFNDEETAKEAYKHYLNNWHCHLFKMVSNNGKAL